MEGVDPIAARIAAQSLINDARAVAECSAEANAAAAGVGYGHVMAAANASIESLTSTLDVFTDLLEIKATAIELAASGVDYGLVGSVQSLGRAAKLTLNSQLDDAYVNPLIAETGLLAPETKAAVEKVLDASKNDPAAMAAVFSELSVETQIEVSQSRPDLVVNLLPELESMHPALRTVLETEFSQVISKSSITVDGEIEIKISGKYGEIGGTLKGEVVEKTDGTELILTASGELGGGLAMGLADAKLGLTGAGKHTIKIKFPPGSDVDGILDGLEDDLADDLPGGEGDFSLRDAAGNPMGNVRESIAELMADAEAVGGTVTKSTIWTGGASGSFEIDGETNDISRAAVSAAGELSFGGQLDVEISSDGSKRASLHVDLDGSAELEAALARFVPAGAHASGAVTPLGVATGEFGAEGDLEIAIGEDSSGQKYLEYEISGRLKASGEISAAGLDGNLGASWKRIGRVEIDEYFTDPRVLLGDQAKITFTRSEETGYGVETVDVDIGALGQGVFVDVDRSHDSMKVIELTVTPPGGDAYEPIVGAEALDDIAVSSIGGQCEVTPGR